MSRISNIQSTTGKYLAAVAIVALAILVVSELADSAFFLKFLCFAATVCWSFTQLGKGPGLCALIGATLATDYWVIDPIYSISFDEWTMLTLISYGALGLLVKKFGSSPEA